MLPIIRLQTVVTACLKGIEVVYEYCNYKGKFHLS